MNELLSKLSSYNLFNNLLPGVIFAFSIDSLTDYALLQDNLLVAFFLYYFIGMIVSRFGSLLVEPFLKKTSFVKFASYSDFIEAEKKDPKIELLSETNNTYRTLLSGIMLLELVLFWQWLVGLVPQIDMWGKPLLIASLLVLFAFSYRKQTTYVRRRVNKMRSSQ